MHIVKQNEIVAWRPCFVLRLVYYNFRKTTILLPSLKIYYQIIPECGNSPVCRNPEPSVSHIIVHEENIALLEGQLICVWHLCVWKYRHDPLSEKVSQVQ